MSEREDGFYWVEMYGTDWEVAEYDRRYGCWYRFNFSSDDSEFFDNDFTQIDERRIVRPDPEVTV